MHRVSRVLHGHRKRPLVIRADRGRGKSALLGLSAAEFLLEDRGDILLTAPRKEAAMTALHHAAQSLGVANGEPSVGDSRLRFLPPDRLLAELPEARLVLVDEAAAIPPALLERLVTAYPRVVFATTVHGYEGSGRGFDIRFTESLNRLTPQWQQIELQEPIRWSEGDPLEALVSRLFLLDAEAPISASADVSDDCVVELLDKHLLLNNEALLRDVFGLLVVAHYQTAPSDLHHLLDSLATHVWVARLFDGTVCAAALVIEEGGLPESLVEPVLQGERRLQGHLLPQSLVYHGGLVEGLSLRCARISRIAVLSDYRRQGFGRRLLQEIEQFACDEGLDYVGSSFAADAPVSEFWLTQGYLPLRLGVRRDPCSGSHALLVAKPFTDIASEALMPLNSRFARHFMLGLRETYPRLEADLIRQLINQLPVEQPLHEDERRDVQRFALGEIAFEHAYPALFRYLQSRPLAELPASEDINLVIARVLQGLSWSELAARHQLKGRREVEHHLRQGYRLLLSLELSNSRF
nr:GNAT family N-acetyltransferase [Litorivivens lipolytica]